MGAEWRYNGFEKHQPYLLALIQEDHSGENIEDIDQDYEYNSRYYGIGSQGEIIKNFYYNIEGVLEDGKSFPDGRGGAAPDNEQIDAWALDASLTYVYDIVTHPAFSAEYARGSGDPDRTDNVTNTIGGNEAGSTDRNFLNFGYLDTGVALAPRMPNLHMYKFGFTFWPSEYVNNKRNIEVGVDFFIFRKDEMESTISDTRADRPQRNIGKEFDVNVTWLIFSDLGASVDYGRFYPGNAYSDKDARDFVMFSMMYQF